MPDIIDTNNPHTLIVRWDDHNNVCEAQFMRLRHIEIDGEVVKHEVTGPTILNHNDLANEPEISALNTDALASVNALTAERDTLRTDLATITTERDTALSERDALTAERNTLRDDIAERDALLSKAAEDIKAGNDNRAALAAHIQELTAALAERDAALTAALEAAKTPELTSTE